MTSPECQEIVQWIIMDEPLYVMRRSLVSGNSLKKKLRLLRKTIFTAEGPQKKRGPPRRWPGR